MIRKIKHFTYIDVSNNDDNNNYINNDTYT